MKSDNYLENVPVKNADINWSSGDDGLVTLEIQNKGFVNRLAQKFFKKPKVSYVHLDKIGSFVWQNTDGEKDLIKIGQQLKEYMGEEAEPLYERLAKYFKILESYGFIKNNKKLLKKI